MLSAILWATLAFKVPEKGVQEVWQGKLETQSAKNKKPAKNPGGGKARGDKHKLPIKTTRKGDKFEGEWIEGKRALEIKGEITNRRMSATPTRIIRGKWNQGILNSMNIEGKVVKDEIEGTMYGDAKKQERAGTFRIRKLAAEPSPSESSASK